VTHDIDRFDLAVREWGIQYVDHSHVSMSGPPLIQITTGSEQDARIAATFTHGSWKDRDVKVISRLVTPWEEES
jgi:hypothetical protein